MTQLFSKWTSMFTDVQSGLMPLAIILAGICLVVIAALAVFARDDVKRSAALQRLITVLGFTTIAAAATGLVTWAAA